MFTFTLLTLLTASSAWAAKHAVPKCDVSGVKVVADSLPPQTAPTEFITLGVGTQNYTCTDGKFVAAGAVAEIFDISCLQGSAQLTGIADVAIALWQKAPAQVTPLQMGFFLEKSGTPSFAPLGEHYFVQNPVNASAGIAAKWDFTSRSFKGNNDAFVVTTKKNNITAPTGKQDIDWLYTTNIAGGLSKEVYRTDTRSGQPAASCSGSEAGIVKYVALYWFTKGTVEAPSCNCKKTY